MKFIWLLKKREEGIYVQKGFVAVVVVVAALLIELNECYWNV